MTAFHEGQEVEVYALGRYASSDVTGWRKAKIVRDSGMGRDYLIEFPDGTRAVFDAENIRAIENAELQP